MLEPAKPTDARKVKLLKVGGKLSQSTCHWYSSSCMLMIGGERPLKHHHRFQDIVPVSQRAAEMQEQ
jgi:hypothetical protein